MKRKQKYCEYCGEPLSESDVNDFGTLCERCYYKEYTMMIMLLSDYFNYG